MQDAANPAMPRGHDDAFDYDAFVTLHWPSLPAAQSHSLASYIYLGWSFVSIGTAGEVNITRAVNAESGYIRTDGIFRNA